MASHVQRRLFDQNADQPSRGVRRDVYIPGMELSAVPLTTETEPADAAALRRSVWTAANLMRASGLGGLDMIEHFTLFLFLRLLRERQHGGLTDMDEYAAHLDSPDLIEECLAERDPAAHFNEKAFPSFCRRVQQAVPANDPLRCLTDGFQPKLDDPVSWRKVAGLISALDFDYAQIDMNGLVYEQLVATLSEAGHLGQYFTPRHIVETMVALVDPEPGESLYDPAAGTGGFLLGAARREIDRGLSVDRLELHGRELNRTVRRLCVMNLLTHGLSPRGVEGGDSLAPASQVKDAFDLVLTNPPFSGLVAGDNVAPFPVQIRSSEGLFLQHLVTALRPGGRAAVVCPEGLLANLGAERELRAYLTRGARVEAVISLPSGVFNPYTAVRTGILVLTKTTATGSVWFFDVRRDGFDLDAKRRPNEQSDLPELLRLFPGRDASPKSVAAPAETVASDDFRLVASRYLRASRPSRQAEHFRELADVCSIRKNAIKPVESGDQTFSYVALEHIESRTGRITPPDATPGKALRSAKTCFQSGDVLYGKLRPYLAKAACVPFDGICSTELVVLAPDPAIILGDFLAHVLRSGAVTEEATALMVGANHPRIHPKDLLRLAVPVPPLEEQHKLMEAIESIESRMTEAEREKDRCRQEIERAFAAYWITSAS